MFHLIESLQQSCQVGRKACCEYENWCSRSHVCFKSHVDLLALPKCLDRGLILFLCYVSRNSFSLKVQNSSRHWVPEQESSTGKLSVSAAEGKTIFRCFPFANYLPLRGEFLWVESPDEPSFSLIPAETRKTKAMAQLALEPQNLSSDDSVVALASSSRTVEPTELWWSHWTRGLRGDWKEGLHISSWVVEPPQMTLPEMDAGIHGKVGVMENPTGWGLRNNNC